MINWDERLRPVVADFGAELLADAYLEDVARVTRGAPAGEFRRTVRALAGSPAPIEAGDGRGTRVALLLLGVPASEAAGRAALGRFLDPLLSLGALTRSEGTLYADRYMVAGLRGRPFIVSRLRHERSAAGSVAAYLGRDTEELADYALAHAGPDVLDLGCGAGIAGILAAIASPGRRVVGVDLCAEAVHVARFNAALNNVPYEALEGDLYQAAGGGQFDLVLADPPSMPFPEDMAFPIYGSGGTEGWHLLARIVEGAEQALRPGGRLFAITELHCPPGHVPFLEWLGGWIAEAPGRQAQLRVVGSRLIPADYYRSLGANLEFLPGADQSTGDRTDRGVRLDAFARRAGVKFGHWIHLELAFARDMPSYRTVVWDRPRPGPESRPRMRVEFSDLDTVLGKHYAHPFEAFGPMAVRFVEEADGINSLADIAGRMPGGPLPYVVDLAHALSELGVVDIITSARGEVVR